MRAPSERAIDALVYAGAFGLALAVVVVIGLGTAAPHVVIREGADESCVLRAPVCYDRWHSVTVPTCDGGTQRLVEEPTFRVTCISEDPKGCP